LDKGPSAEEIEAERQAELLKQQQRRRDLEEQELQKKLKEKGMDGFKDSQLSVG
jgi:hypothetical protein